MSEKVNILKNQHSSEIQSLIKACFVVMKSNNKDALPSLNEMGFKVYSQFEEDGLLLYIFSLIKTTNKKVVEICAGDGTECMASNLIIHHGWNGLLFDGDQKNVEKGRKFFESNPNTFLIPPKFVHSWITIENVNKIISDNGFHGSIDLLSLDIDGNDYWILKEIDIIQPRVIICETQDIIPSDLSLTIPYTPDFYYHDLPKEIRDFRSVSLLVMKNLCNSKGYRLIGAHKYGFNVIFMRNDVGLEYFPEVQIDTIHNNPWTKFGQENRWEKVKDQDWQSV